MRYSHMVSYAGLTRVSINLQRKFVQKAWMAGSSPATTSVDVAQASYVERPSRRRPAGNAETIDRIAVARSELTVLARRSIVTPIIYDESINIG
jgi:hypothetical protein